MFLALQIGDKYRITTPVNWRKGEDVIVHPSVTTEEAKVLFPEHTVHKVQTCVYAIYALTNIITALPQDHPTQGRLKIPCNGNCNIICIAHLDPCCTIP